MKKLILAGVAGIALAIASPAFADYSVGPVFPNSASGPVFAGNVKMNKDCRNLESEFDQTAALRSQSDLNLSGAGILRRDGASMCRKGRYAAGLMTLHAALRSLGVGPMHDAGPLAYGFV